MSVIPYLELPKKIRSARQYVLWTKRCRDMLLRYHFTQKGSVECFIRIADTEPSMNYHGRFPIHWQSKWRFAKPLKFSGYLEYMPRNAIVYWPEGVDISGEAYNPCCPIAMLEDVQIWMGYKVEDLE